MRYRSHIDDDAVRESPALFVAQNDRARAILKSLDLPLSSFAMPKIGIANRQTRNRLFWEPVPPDDFLCQNPMPRRWSGTSSSVESQRYSSGISLLVIDSATAASKSSTGTTSR